MTDEYNILAEEDKQRVIANTPTLTPYENTEFYWVESAYTFKQMMMTTGDDIDWSQMPIWRRELYQGPFQDAVTWSNGENTLNLDDFDTPRVTTEGIEYNPSGGVGFTVRENWRLTFELETDSSLDFINDNTVEGVETSGNKFDFTMYSGDRLEIDIDNEREGVGPFFISIKGKEWFTTEEPDDEVSLTLKKAEKLFVKYESGQAWILPDGTERTDLERVSPIEYDVVAWNPDLETGYHRSQIVEHPDYSELQYSHMVLK